MKADHKTQHYGNLGEYGPLKHKTNQFNHRLFTLLLYTVSILRQASVNHFNIKFTSFRMLVFVAYYDKHTHWVVQITPNI